MFYKEAREIAVKYDEGLLATDRRFDKIAHIVHEDGSTMLFTNAFIMEKDAWYFVFTEHNGCHVFSKDDLASISEYERCDGKIEHLDFKEE